MTAAASSSASAGSERPGDVHPALYPPIDIPKPIAENVWVVDSGPKHVFGIPLPVRMTVIRLPGGELLLHSPTQFSPDLKIALEKLGAIKFLIAPNVAHWTFLPTWQRACPDVAIWAAPGLGERHSVRKAGIRIDAELTNAPPPAWGDVIEVAAIPGGGGFREVAFFHRPSRTLVLTDLVQNLEPQKLPGWVRPLAKVAGVTAPDGRAPIYLRGIVKLRRREAAMAVSHLLRLAPDRVVFAHGTWFDRDASERLRRSLSWLTRVQ